MTIRINLSRSMNCVGIDVIEIGRIEQAVSRGGQHFLKRIYTDRELEACHGRLPALAARFAAKEAIMKLLGTGLRGLCWVDIETIPNSQGQPIVYLSGGAKDIARKMGLRNIAISLSHTREYAVASAIGSAD